MVDAILGVDEGRLQQLQSLTELLEYRAEVSPDQVAFVFAGENITFGGLWAKAKLVSGFLTQKGLFAGDRVVLIFENGPEFFYAFFGVQAAGAVPVPIFPGSSIARIKNIVAVSGARCVLLPSAFEKAKPDDFEGLRAMFESANVMVFALNEDSFNSFPVYVHLEESALAMLQYTSGSTGESKGVMLSHRNLLANIRQMIEASQITPADVLVSWLPVYHDLGLILMGLSPLYVGAKLVLLPTSLTRLESWLEAISSHGGTYTAAPDIAYRQVLKLVQRPERFDLKSLRVAINAAEPVRAKTVRDFETSFGLSDVMKPSYGLAEASVGVSFWGLESKQIKVDEHGHVSVGRALPGIELKVLVEGREALAGEYGELVLRSPSATSGYFRDEVGSAELFALGDFVRTGDIAYFDDEGDLFIVGRNKNVIKQGGRTLAPREVEELVESLDGVRMAAALGISRDNRVGEQLFVFVELRLSVERVVEEGSEFVQKIVQKIHDNLNLRPARVYLVAKHTIPITFNGKLKHSELKDAFVSGELRKVGKLLYPNDIGTLW